MRSLLCVAALWALAACARDPAAGTPASQVRSTSTRNVITEEEIARGGQGSAFEIIRRLRPEFFSSRGVTSLEAGSQALPDVVLDGVPVGGIDALRQVPAGTIRLVRLYRASEVPARYSSRYASGLIEVTTK